MSSSVPYVALEQRFKRLADLGGAAAVLNWDQAAVMPKGGNAARGEQLAALGGVVHEILVAPETRELIEAARGPTRRLAGGQPGIDRAALHACHRLAAGPGRGPGAGHQHL